MEPAKIDVCSARMEYYPQPASLPLVSLSSIKMDLYRRDFTINALALQVSPSSAYGGLCDFFHGQRDLQERSLRTLHSLSFVDDPSRIMRAVRFSSRYGYDIEKQTLKFLKGAVADGHFLSLSGSRKWHEFHCISEESPEVARKAFELASSLNLLQQMHPLLECPEEVGERLMLAGQKLNWFLSCDPSVHIDRALLYLTLLLFNRTEEEVKSVCKSFLLESKADRISHQLALHRQLRSLGPTIDEAGTRVVPLSEVHRAVADGGGAAEAVVLLLASPLTAPSLQADLTRLHVTVGPLLHITGHDLIQHGIPHGRIVQHIKTEVENATIDGLIATTADAQLEHAMRVFQGMSEEERGRFVVKKGAKTKKKKK